MALSCSSGANVSVTGGRSHTVEQAAVRGKTVRACWPARIVRFRVGKWVSSGELMPVRERVRGQACVRIRGLALIGARVGVGFRACVRGRDVGQPVLGPVGWFPVLVFAGIVASGWGGPAGRVVFAGAGGCPGGGV